MTTTALTIASIAIVATTVTMAWNSSRWTIVITTWILGLRPGIRVNPELREQHKEWWR